MRSCLVVLVSIFLVAAIARAGNMAPSGVPAASGYTLGDIFTRLTTNATSTEEIHGFAPGASPAGSLHSLTDIYAAIPAIDASQVLSGTSYLGVAGAYNAANLTAGNVKNGVAYGVSSTGTFKTHLPDTGNGNPRLCYNDSASQPCNDGNTGWPRQDADAVGDAAACSLSFTPLTIGSDSVVLDNCTNLMWTKCPYGASGSDCSVNEWGTMTTWKAALQTCATLNYGGYTDWRLPNVKELLSLLDFTYDSNLGVALINAIAFPNSTPGNVWSATTPFAVPGRAYSVDFWWGAAVTSSKADDNEYVRCVRNN